MTTKYYYPFIILHYTCICIAQKISIMLEVFKKHLYFICKGYIETKVPYMSFVSGSKTARFYRSVKKRIESSMLELLAECAILGPLNYFDHVCMWVKIYSNSAYKNSFILKCWIICHLGGICQYVGSHLHLSKANGICCLPSSVHTSTKLVQALRHWRITSPQVQDDPWLYNVSRKSLRFCFWRPFVFSVKCRKTDTCKTKCFRTYLY